ncbi:NADH-quinone oxidoreductase subunit NuoH [Oceanicaulis alexandrii]|jgi:NADH-quinone oxidoreductase subunit H|uniref:NADH-quinone oxidoreductase subunit NuoH n=1 Tax=Oceanicaulis TaxID=153232 RepID=UPI0003B4C7BE|nr:NADH-quinone oxidoreductase subunit NuoH [Oceanicaulis alexandrii]VXC47825.1 NADH:ubiquinone oxidoreductase, membrane subunit H [Oceanicaulis sp. 350]HCR66392.1 NADH-quinone oxidoreductase subunit NuoH [Oceanicaulis sp.]|tara:strand:- start:543 stop:1595 length:1053 start_codon:yes stop_codon:yes gene_type:complete
MYDFVTQWGPLWGTLASVGQILGFMVVLLLSLAFLLLMDRKVWAAVQMRKGPNTVGAFGLLQSFADFIKFVLKEIIVPAGADRPLFILAPLLTLTFAFITWAVIPVAPGWVISDLNVGILYIFAISSLGVYGIIIGGWASNSKYPFLGAMRSAAQMVSYEVSIGFILVTILLMVGSMNLTDIVEAQAGGFWNWHVLSFDMFPVPVFVITIPMFVMFFISALAETNRPPFDLPEAESELVAGYQVEYSSTPYLLFMIGEYLNIVLMCALMTVLFMGGWHAPFDIVPFTWVPPVFWFAIKVVLFFFMFAMVKALVPRYRYDQLMRLGWKIFLPTSLAAVALMGGIVAYSNAG